MKWQLPNQTVKTPRGYLCKDLTRDSLKAKSPKLAALDQGGEARDKPGIIGEGPATPARGMGRTGQ